MCGGWIQHAAGVERVHAFALEFAFDPALEHVDHLEFDVVIMRRRHLFRLERRDEADDMRLHHAAGRRRDAEIAVFGVSAQALVEIRLAVMADGEFVLRPRLGSRLARFGFRWRAAPLALRPWPALRLAPSCLPGLSCVPWPLMPPWSSLIGPRRRSMEEPETAGGHSHLRRCRRLSGEAGDLSGGGALRASGLCGRQCLHGGAAQRHDRTRDRHAKAPMSPTTGSSSAPARATSSSPPTFRWPAAACAMGRR